MTGLVDRNELSIGTTHGNKAVMSTQLLQSDPGRSLCLVRGTTS